MDEKNNGILLAALAVAAAGILLNNTTRRKSIRARHSSVEFGSDFKEPDLQMDYKPQRIKKY